MPFRQTRASCEQLESRVLLTKVTAQDSDHLDTRPDWMTNTYQPPTIGLTRVGEFLSTPQSGKPMDIAWKFLRSNAGSLGMGEDDLSDPIITSSYTDAHNGVTHVYYQQRYNGLPVINARANVSVMRDGRVLTAYSSFVDAPPPAKSIAAPELGPIDALRTLNDELQIPDIGEAHLLALSDAGNPVVDAPSISAKPIEMKLVYLAQADGSMQLAYHFDLDMPDHQHWYSLAVSVADGKVLFANDYVDQATYTALNPTSRSPNDGAPFSQSNLEDPGSTASPYGWHDTNGVAGAEYTITRGNNVYAYLDTNNDGAPDTDATPGSVASPDGGPSLNFNFPPNFSQPLTTAGNQRAAVVNLFTAVNYIHDVSYGYGFNEQAANFQVNNYGKGGAGNDAVSVEAQDPAEANNASMTTPPDGSSPRMQIGIWNSIRDASFDQQVIYHEFTHGISNRLTGNANGLQYWQSRSMGEGWSDFAALVLTAKPSDIATTSVGMATYLIGQASTGAGIRAYPYTTDMNVNPLTANNMNSNSAGNLVHGPGTVWASALWEVYWNLVQRYGYSSNLYGGWQPGQEGNKLALQLVLDGMKLQPVNPRFSDARDAILQADLALTGGANYRLIWQAFAKRGFGFSFQSGSNANVLAVAQAFDVPPSIYGRVINDANDNGVADATETGLSGFTVFLDMNGNGYDNRDIVTTTDSTGYYTFGVLATGTYSVCVLTAGYRAVSASSVNVTVTATYPGWLNKVDFLLTDRARITGTVYNDLNRNGGRDAGEPGVSGARVYFDTILNNRFDDTSFAGTQSTPLYLPDDGVVRTSSLLLNAPGVSVDPSQFSLRLNVTHTMISHQRIVLISPAGTRVIISNFNGGYGDGFNGTITQTASLSTASWPFDNLPIVGTWQPEESFSAFAGQPVSGTWTLEFYANSFPGYAGTLNNWGLSGGFAETSAVTDSSGVYLISNLDGGGYRTRVLLPGSTWQYVFPSFGLAILGMAPATTLGFDWGIANNLSLLSSSYNFDAVAPQVVLNFSGNTAINTGNFTLTNRDTSTVIPPSTLAASFNSTTNQAAITFPGQPAGRLPDGNYRLTLDNSFATGQLDFFVLAADANRDRKVDTQDFNLLAANFGGTSKVFSQGNFDYDAGGAVDSQDFNLFIAQYGKKLAPPGSATSLVASGAVFAVAPTDDRDKGIFV